MGRAQAKTADGYRAACPAVAATVVDALPDLVTVRVDLTDQLLGAMWRARADHLLITIAGAEWRAALPPVQAVR